MFLLFPPFRPAILEPHLNPSLGQLNANGQLLAEEHVRIVGALEGSFQFLQLGRIECGPMPVRDFVCVFPFGLGIADTEKLNDISKNLDLGE